jgi:ribosomal protein S18 acetylase RimI-like enzyme
MTVDDARGFRTRILGPQDREAALEVLAPSHFEDLFLVDAVLNLGRPLSPREIAPLIYGAFDGDRLCGIASFRPSIVFSTGMPDPAAEALLPLVRRIPSGLVKCDCRLVERIWKVLESVGRRSMIDRIEIAYRLMPEAMIPASPLLPGLARPARAEDLEDLVYAARASLWEEDRPDPADGDPVGFRRWVESRLSRARIVSENGSIVFVSYADVRRTEGWLVQGVYTWPAARRQGYARRGMDSVIREAFASSASHVQLAVIEGNERASALYRHLGFEPFAELRTIHFH